jgi:hypothetical protein
MSVDEPRFEKLFTIEQANAALPLVRAICTDLAELSREVLERKERLSWLLGGRPADRRRAEDPYRSELEHIQEELERDTHRLQEYVGELRHLGVEPKNGLEGLVDFPSLMDGRIVYLCWKLGEPEVQWWHELDAGFVGRQPLLAESVPDGGER